MGNNQIQQVSVGGIILNEKKEVLVLKRSENDDFLPGFWEIPGGGLDYGENPEEGLKREIKEECGIDVEVLNPVVVTDYFMDKGEDRVHRVEINFTCHPKNKDQAITLSSEHMESMWTNLDQVVDLKMSDLMKKIIAKTK